MLKTHITVPQEPAGSQNHVRVSRPTSARWALTALALSMLLSSLGTSIANVGLPTFAEAFGASFQAVQWVVLAYLLAITTLVVSAGRLGDLFGRRKVLLAGIAVFTLASALCAAAPALWLLIAARAVQGLGAAAMMALTMALVAEAVPKEQTGRAMGLLGTMSAVGTALGPSLGGVLIAGAGWQALFLVKLPLGVLAFMLAWRHLPLDRQPSVQDRPRFDTGGTLLLALTLAAYALAMTVGRGDFGAVNLALLLAAGVVGGLFLVVQTRVAYPLIRLSLLRDQTFGTRLATHTLVATVMMATLVVGPFYLARSLGLSPALVGAVMSMGPVIAALSGLLAGQMVDRWGAPRMTVAGLIAMVVGAAGLSLLATPLGLVGYIAAIAILTPGYQLFQAANNTAVMEQVAPDQRGVVSGMLNLSRNLGLVTGASAMGAVFVYAAGATDIATAAPGAVADGMRFTFAVAAGLVALALAWALARGWSRR